MISAEELRSVLAYDPLTGVFTWLAQSPTTVEGRRWNTARAGRVAGANHQGRISIRVLGTRYLAHRLAWLYVTGAWPANEIDHANGDAANNRFSNLREATRSQNMANTRRGRRNVSGFKGVRRHRDKWQATIVHNGKFESAGTFDTPEEAHSAYTLAAKRLFGEFARAA